MSKVKKTIIIQIPYELVKDALSKAQLDVVIDTVRDHKLFVVRDQIKNVRIDYSNQTYVTVDLDPDYDMYQETTSEPPEQNPGKFL